MSYWSDVYAGDANVIAGSFNDGRRAEGPKVLAHAELSGVVPDASGELPNTPNLLTELAASIARVESLSFADSIAQHLAGDPDPAEATSGAYRMSDEWTKLFAELTEEHVRLVAQQWAKECDPGATSDAPQAALVRSLRDVCRVAKERNVSVIYTWTM
jgi:hypothetical protein